MVILCFSLLHFTVWVLNMLLIYTWFNTKKKICIINYIYCKMSRNQENLYSMLSQPHCLRKIRIPAKKKCGTLFMNSPLDSTHSPYHLFSHHNQVTLYCLTQSRQFWHDILRLYDRSVTGLLRHLPRPVCLRLLTVVVHVSRCHSARPDPPIKCFSQRVILFHSGRVKEDIMGFQLFTAWPQTQHY